MGEVLVLHTITSSHGASGIYYCALRKSLQALLLMCSFSYSWLAVADFEAFCLQFWTALFWVTTADLLAKHIVMVVKVQLMT